MSVRIDGKDLEAGKTYEVTVTATLVDGQSKSITIQFMSSSEPDFYAEMTPFYVASAEQDNRIPITIIPQNNFNGEVSIEAIDVPNDMEISVIPAEVNLKENCTVQVSIHSLYPMPGPTLTHFPWKLHPSTTIDLTNFTLVLFSNGIASLSPILC